MDNAGTNPFQYSKSGERDYFRFFQSRIVSFFITPVILVNEIIMKRLNASDLLKKLESGKITREEFTLFLEGIEDPKQADDFDLEFRKSFDRFMKGPDPSLDEEKKTLENPKS